MQALKAGALVDNRFEIIELLGSGGMGMVYKAKQLELDRTVALKFLLPHLYEDERTLARFKVEAEALSTLSHRNISLFYAYGVWHGRAPYIAMEYLQAPSLADELAAGGSKITWRRTLQICQQICDGIAHAHANGIIHRDLKPTNIFVLQEENGERVKISDFGLAKMIDDSGEQKLTATGYTVGSPHYMSPEQAQAVGVTFAADIYSVGCIMYECLFGRPPFDADTPVHVIYQHANSPCPLPDDKRSKDLPTGIVSIIETALAKTPSERFASMEEMSAAIAAVISSTEAMPDNKSTFIGGTRAPTSTGEPGQSPLTRYRTAFVSAFAVIFLLVCFNFQTLTRLGQDLALNLAPNRYEAAKIEIAQFLEYQKLNWKDREQDALEHLVEDLKKALTSKEFKKDKLAAQRQFMHSAAFALMYWHPAQGADVEKLSGCQGLAADIDGEDGTLFNTLLFRFSRPVEHVPENYLAWGMDNALSILEAGPRAQFRRQEIEMLRRGIGDKVLSLTPEQMMEQASKVKIACAQHQIPEADELLVPIFFSYALGDDQGALARCALSSAVTTLDTEVDSTPDVSEYTYRFIARSYHALSLHYSHVGDAEALSYLRRQVRAEERRRAPRDYYLIGRTQLFLGDALREQGKTAEAMKVYQQSIDNDRKGGNGKIDWIAACAQLSQADMLCEQSKWKEALALYRAVSEMNVPVTKESHVMVGRLAGVLPAQKLGELDRTFENINRQNALIAAAFHHNSVKDRSSIFYQEVQMGNVYYWLGEYDKALAQWNLAEKLATGDYEREALTLRRARVALKQNDLGKALAGYRKALSGTRSSHFPEFGSPDEVLAWRLEYGGALNHYGNPEEAKRVLLDALAWADNRGGDQTTIVMREIARELAAIYGAQGNAELALKYMNKTLDFDLKSNHITSRHWADENVDRGFIAALEGKDDIAEMAFRSALSQMDDSHERDYPRTMAALARLALKHGDRAEARRLYATAIQRWDQYLQYCHRDIHSTYYREAVDSLNQLSRRSPKP